ncbi:MAG: amidohydrolase family protein [Solirubrobacteraceae bacterium]
MIELHLADWVLAADPDATGLLVEDGRVAAAGDRDTLRRAHPGINERRHERAWIVPGLRNAHGHLGGWPPDTRLELFLVGRYDAIGDEQAMHVVALATGLRLVAAGVTWTHHLHYGPWAATAARAYREAGLRVQLCLGVLDRYSVIPYDDGDQALHRLLSPQTRKALDGRELGKRTAPVEIQLERFHELQAELSGDDGIEVILGPDNPQWCTDHCLQELHATGAPLHLHVQENPSQYARALAATGITPVERLERLGVLGPNTTLAHLTHSTAADLDRVAASGASAALNVSSNLRLGSGVPPIAEIDARGISWGLGADGGGLLDDQDLWNEARLALLLSRARVPPSNAPAPTAERVLKALTGSLASDEPADFVVLEAPADVDRAQALLRRVDSRWVREVYVGGEPVVLDHRPCAGPVPPPAGAQVHDPLARALLEPIVRGALDTDTGPRWQT